MRHWKCAEQLPIRRLAMFMAVLWGLVASMELAACRGESSVERRAGMAKESVSPVLYTITGTVENIGAAGTWVILGQQGDNLKVTGPNRFTFVRPLAPGSRYRVEVLATSSGLSCTVINGHGVMGNAPVNNVIVHCSAPQAYTWPFDDGSQSQYTYDPNLNFFGGLVTINGGDPAARSIFGDTPVTYTHLYAVQFYAQPSTCATVLTTTFSPDAVHWYYHTAAQWTLADGSRGQSMSVSTITPDLLSDYVQTIGSGTLYVKTFLDAQGVGACSLDAVNVIYDQNITAPVPGVAVRFTVTGLSSPRTAGTAGSVTVTAYDAFGAVATGYAGTVALSSTDGQAGLPGAYTFTSGDAGVKTLPVTLYTVGTQNVAAGDTQTLSLSGVELGIVVQPGPVKRLALTRYPSPQNVGVQGNVLVTAVDNWNNTVPSYTGTVHLTSDDPNAILPANYTFALSDAGQRQLPVTFGNGGSWAIGAQDTTVSSIYGIQRPIQVNALPVAKFRISVNPNVLVAGQSSSVEITALDNANYLVRDYNGQVALHSSDLHAILPGPYTFTSSNQGDVTLSGLSFVTSGNQTLSANDTLTPAVSGVEYNIIVSPNVAVRLVASGYPASVVAGQKANILVSAYDAYNNLATGYTGTVHLSTTDANATTPGNYTFGASSAGQTTLPVTFTTAGLQNINANDTNQLTLAAQQPNILVNPNAAVKLTFSGLASPRGAGVLGNVTVTARDIYNNIVTGYTGTVHFNSSDAMATLPGNTTFAVANAGVTTVPVNFATAGNQTLSANDMASPSIAGIMPVVVQSTYFTLGGNITGLLTNTNVTLVDTNDTILSGNGNFAFPTQLAYNSNFSVSLVQPVGQTCAFVGNSNVGIMPNANDTNIRVACTTNTYALGGNVTGLLANTNVTLTDANDTLLVQNGNFIFPTGVAYNSNFSVSLTNPNGQTCVFVSNSNTGVMPAANDMNVRLSCTTNQYSLGGTISGLLTNTNVTLADANDTLLHTNGAYTFPTLLPSGRAYSIGLTNPTGQTCVFSPNSVGSGSIAYAPVTNANVTCTTNIYPLGGRVSGLISGNVTLTNAANADAISVGNGNYLFDQNVAYASNYNVVVTQPTGLLCSVSNSNGLMTTGGILNVNVTCTPTSYILGGQISGLLSNTNVTLQDTNDSISAGNGNFTFPTGVPYNSNFVVSLTQPTGQTCAFTGNTNTGVMPAANDMNVRVACTTKAYTLGGSVVGLLTNTNVTLADANDTLLVQNGNFTFPTSVLYNSNFLVSLVNPNGQTCVFVSNSNQGVMPAANDTNIQVSCQTNLYSLGGRVLGLLTNTNVTLNDGNDTILPTNGLYNFPTSLPSGRTYSIGLTNPTGQSCVFSPNSVGAGTIVNANIANANVTCTTNTYPLGGRVSGLVSGNVTLTNTANTDVISVGNGNYLFDQNVAYASNYNVVVTQPAGLACAVSNSNGLMTTGGVLNVNVTCAPVSYTLGGQISGLLSNTNVALQDTNDSISSGNGNFTFPTGIPYNSNFVVSLTQPTGQSCAFTGNTNTGVMPAANDTNVRVACTTNAYTLGGSVSGLLSNTNVTLADANDTLLVQNGNFTFPTAVLYNSNFMVNLTNPNGQTCVFASNSNVGVMPAMTDTNIVVTCTTNQYSLGGMISGLLTNTNVTLNDGNDTLLHTNGAYTFATLLPSGRAYSIGIINPTGQSCVFSPNSVGSGNIVSAPVTNANVVCTTNTYVLGGRVSGLISGNVTLTNTVSSDVISVANGNYLFDQNVAYASNYNVVVTQPAGLSCAVANSNGAMAAGGIFNINVTCAPASYILGGKVSGLITNTNVTLIDTNDTISAGNGNFAFPTSVPYNSNFLVSLTQPTGQTCNFTGNSNAGVMPPSNDMNVLLACTTNSYTLGGSVTGLLSNTNLTLTDVNDTVLVQNGNFTFPTLVLYNSNFTVNLTNPNGQSCTFVSNSNTGVMPASTDMNVVVSCTSNQYSLGGRVSGLLTNTNVTLNDGNDTLLPTNGGYTFPTLLPSGRAYSIGITNPTGQSCVFSPNAVGSGTIAASPVTNANVVCTTNTYVLGGRVSGLNSGNVTLTNAANSDVISVANGNYTFDQNVAYASNYNVVVTQPTGMSCTVANGNGAMAAGGIFNVNVTCAPASYILGGKVSGLITNTNVTLIDTNDTISAGNGNFAFPTSVPYNSNFLVSLTQPTGQTCNFTSNSNAGMMPPSNDMNVLLACTTNSYTLGGSVTGLQSNTNVTLADVNDTVLVQNGNFTFPTAVLYNSNFIVNLTNPNGQSCTFVSNSNTGVMPASTDMNVVVSCTSNQYSLGGRVSGLLTNTNVTLNDGNDTLLPTNGGYTFPTLLPSGRAYSIGITNPTGQSCVFSPNAVGSGTIAASPVTNANVVCTTNTYVLGGRVSGLISGNVTLTNTANSDVISVANGNYTFDQNVAYASNYNVVVTQPTGMSCTVANGNATMPAGGILNVNVTCAPTAYTLGGKISGLITNTNVTLIDTNDTISAGNGNFTFPTGVPYNSNFIVSLTNPTGQTCAFTGNSNTGVMPASTDTNVVVACTTNKYTLGGVVAGLLTNTNVTLTDANDTLLVQNGNFTFPTTIAYNSNFTVSLTSPSGQTCTFTSNSNAGVMPASTDMNVLVSCTANLYSLGGRVSGLITNTNVTLNDGNDTYLPTNGAYTFPTLLPSGRAYSIGITNPTGQSCVFSPNAVGSGTIAAASVTNANVVCTTNTYVLGGRVTGLASGNVTLTNSVNSDVISVPNGGYAFDQNVGYGANYNVVITQPSGVICTVANGNGTMPASSVLNANVTCVAAGHTLGGTVSGLIINTNVALTDGTDSLTAGNGNFYFPTLVANNANFTVSLTQPTGQTCNFTGNSNYGVMPNANDMNVVVACTTNTYTLGGSVTGLLGSTNVTLVNGANTVTPTNGNFTFTTQVAYNSNFSVSLTSPSGQTCVFVSNSNVGVMPAATDMNVVVSCTQNNYTLGGRISGLITNTNVTLADGNDTIATSNGAYTFPTALPSGRAYSIGITNPTGQACVFSPNAVGSGTMASANVTNANVVCTTNTYVLAGSVTGLTTGNITVTNTINTDAISVGNGNFAFDQNVAYLGNYNVISTSPNGMTCAVTNGTATMPVGGNSNVRVTCTMNPATKLLVRNYTTPRTAGQNSNVNITAYDASNNVAIGYTGTVHLITTDPNAVFSPNITFVSGYAGSANVPFTMKTSGTQSITGNDTTTPSISGIQTGIVVNPNSAVLLQVGGYTSPAAAGVSDTFTVTAYDTYGNIATGYTGTVHFTSSDANAVLPANTTFATGDVGSVTLSATFKTEGTQRITGNDTVTASIAGIQNGIVVNGGNATSLKFTTVTSVTAGNAFDISITAFDQYNNIANTYAGTVVLAATNDGRASFSPTSYTFQSSDQGQVTLSSGGTLKTSGVRQITGNDGSLSCLQNITVAASTMTRIGIMSYQNTYWTEQFNLAMSALDAYSNLVTSYAGTASVTSTDAGTGAKPKSGTPQSVTFSGGLGSISNAEVVSPGTVVITAADSTNSKYGSMRLFVNKDPNLLINNTNANYLIGQTSWTSTTSGGSQTTLNGAQGAWFSYNGTIYIADTNNHRVLGYNAIPTGATGSGSAANANFVIGQPDFTTVTSGVSATKMNRPTHIATDGNNGMFVLDQGNHRVLHYNTLPTTTNTAADQVIGQVDFASTASGCTRNTMMTPSAVHSYPGFDVFAVSDAAANRILVYGPTSSIASGASPIVVIGQPDFNTCTPGTSATKLSAPIGVVGEPPNLYVADSNNNRLAIFTDMGAILSASTNGPALSAVVGQSDNNSGGVKPANPNQSTWKNPTHLTFDGLRVHVSDAGNNRYMFYGAAPASLYSGYAATSVQMQANFTTTTLQAASQKACGDVAYEISVYQQYIMIACGAGNRVMIWIGT